MIFQKIGFQTAVDPGFEKERGGGGGVGLFYLIPKSDSGGATIVCLTRVWQSLLPLFCDKTFEFAIQT